MDAPMGQKQGTAVTIGVRTMGRTFGESAVDQWELKAARRALRNLKELSRGRVMLDLLAEQIEAGDRFHKKLIDDSDGSYRESRTDLIVRGLSATDLVDWYQSQIATGDFEDKLFLLTAHPEHYVEPLEYPGMVENIGGYPTRFRVQVAGSIPSAVSEFLDPAYPLTLATARLSLDDGTPFAYCLHQARDTEVGADVAVRVVYPAAAPDSMIDGHCEHLAIEFRSWIRNAAATIQPVSPLSAAELRDAGGPA